MRLSPRSVLAWLVALAAVSWAIVLAELWLASTVSVLAIANAAVFTVTLAIWPALTGTRVDGDGVRVPDACVECGALVLPVPAIRFCIRCGAYPKAVRA